MLSIDLFEDAVSPEIVRILRNTELRGYTLLGAVELRVI